MQSENFKSGKNDQSKSLMDKLKSTVHFTNLNKEQAKQKIITEAIGMADWSSMKAIYANNQSELYTKKTHTTINTSYPAQPTVKIKC